MDTYIERLIKVHRMAVTNIAEVEKAIQNYPITSEKDKANFGNLCILLKGFRMVEESSECLLINEDCVVSNDGNYFKKIDVTAPEPTVSNPNEEVNKSE